MSEIRIGEIVPDFELPATGNQTLRLSDLREKNVVLYFYPKDSTPGCTREGQDFRDHIQAFDKLDTVIVGVSRDSLKSHEKFKETQCFPFALLSDQDELLCSRFGVIKEKNMYGKKVMGIERSTFLIDAKGVLRREWRKVKVDGHVAEVLDAVKQL
jgi:peroxiredoxin Q/BCP